MTVQFRTFHNVVIALLVSCVVVACSSVTTDTDDTPPVDAVMPLAIGDRAFVHPGTMARGLTNGGMSPQNALRFGPHIMEMIADHGGAELYITGELSYVISVFGDSLYVTSLEHGLTVVKNVS